MSFKAEMNDGSGFVGNMLRFATGNEAQLYGKELMSRWMAAREMRVVPSNDPVNYVWDQDKWKAVAIPEDEGNG